MVLFIIAIHRTFDIPAFERKLKDEVAIMNSENEKYKATVFPGVCFWRMGLLFDVLKGIIEVIFQVSFQSNSQELYFLE